MTSIERYVILGLARPRADWFRSVAQWSTTASIPAEFAKCVSLAELRARLGSGRQFSAVLLDGGLAAVDRDVVEQAREAGCAVFVVDDGLRAQSWPVMGVHAVLPSGFPREALLDALVTHAVMVGHRGVSVIDGEEAGDAARTLGSVIAVCGPGGTGSSTVAAALAQGLAADDARCRVVLADLARHAEQAMLHDVRDVVPGIQELVDGHRLGAPSDADIKALVYDVVDRRYHLLLGLRRARHWTTIRPRSFDAAFASLRRCFDTVVCDVTADLEGESDAGSADVEERNVMARAAVQLASTVFVVGVPGVKGTHAVLRVMEDLVAAGVSAGRVVPVFNQAPRHPKARATLARAVADLAPGAMGGGSPTPPIFLPTRKVEEAWRDGAAMPSPLPSLLARAHQANIRRVGEMVTLVPQREAVVPGSLGGWSSDV